MFTKLKRMVDDVLDHLESKIEDVSGDDVDQLIRAMRDELVQTKSRIPELEALLESQVTQADREKQAAEVAERREVKAAAIDDQETVEVARRFSAQHRQRLEVLVIKAEATRAEILQHKDEVVQMTEQLKDAISRRDSLGVQHRRAKAIENSTSRFDSVDAFDRMAEKMEGATDIDEARREVDLDLDPLAHRPVRDFAAERAARESNAEDMLEELKRRMEEGD